MAIVSISVNDKILSELDKLQEKLGYTGRSEIVRSALRGFLEEQKSLEVLDQDKLFSGSMTITMPESSKEALHRVEKGHDVVIKTHVHHCLPGNMCMNVFVIEGKGRKIREFVRAVERIPKVDSVKVVLAI